MASSPYILTSVDEALVYSGVAPDPEFEGEEAPTDPRVVVELNDGEPVAQLFLDPDGARELSRRLIAVANEVDDRVAMLVTAARGVIANWDHGDLAAAVRDLSAALREGGF